MKRLLVLLVVMGTLICAGCSSRDWQVYSEQEIRNRAIEKMEVEGYNW